MNLPGLKVSVKQTDRIACLGQNSILLTQNLNNPKPIDINAMMPLINEKVSSIKSQYHCMKIIRDTIGFLNPNQIPVDVSDQPVICVFERSTVTLSFKFWSRIVSLYVRGSTY